MQPRSTGALFIASCLFYGSFNTVAPALAQQTNSPPKTTGLQEIGHVKAVTQFCQDVVDDAAFSTSMTLQNDATFVEGFHRVATTELDEDAAGRPKLIAAIIKDNDAVVARAKVAIATTKALRTLAATAPTPEQKAALIAYADALGGAAHRQEQLSREYLEYSVYLQANDPVSWQDHDRALMAAAVTAPRPGEMATDPRDRVPQTLDDGAKYEAERLFDVHDRIIVDEVKAADSSDSALAPCRPDAPLQTPAP